MNVSGPGVGRAWRGFLSELGHQGRVAEGGGEGGGEPRLVILHDELEAELGDVRVRKGEKGSLKGHNGLRSVRETLAAQGGGRMGMGMGMGMGKEEWWRIGVGIGRPVSRERGAVSEWVLRNMTAAERRGVEDTVGRTVDVLRGLREGWVVV